MILKIREQHPDGEREVAYAVHFHHVNDPKRVFLTRPPAKAMTTCVIHTGPCARQERPCQTDHAQLGIAFLSMKDQFRKAIGRKLAFTRAVRIYPKEVRTLLHREYIAKVGVPS